MSGAVICQGCGRKLEIDANPPRRKVRCPDCGVMSEVPEHARRSPRSTAAVQPAPAEPTPAAPRPSAKPVPPSTPPSALRKSARTATDDEDSSPYTVIDTGERRCSGCGKVLTPDAVVCHGCGFNLQTRKKPVRVYEKIARSWEAGLPLPRRILCFAGLQVVVLPLALTAALLADELPLFFICWTLFSVMIAFLLGTFDRIDLSRNERGQIRLTKTWRVCFVPQAAQVIRLGDYEGITSGQSHDSTFWDWAILLILLPFALFPAVIWWFYAIYHDTFHVALTRDHGYPEVILYRGWSEEHMKDVARTLSAAAELPWDGG